MALTSFAITQPLWLYALLFGLVVLAGLLWRWPGSLSSPSVLLLNLARRAYRHPQYAQLLALQQVKAKQQVTRHWLARFFAYAVLLSLLCLSLAQPYRLGKRLPAPQQHRDIVFIVDTSLDMLLRDYVVAGQRTSRMTMLKDVLRHFIQALHGNRIGLIVFSEQPYYYVPLTNDYALLQFQLQRLQAAVLTGRSTDISRALLYSLRWVDNDPQKAHGPKPLLVLISDANRTARHIDPRAAAKYLALRHFHLHTIAIGAGSYAAEDKTHESMIYHPASFYLLQGIARAGNGKFFWAKDQASLQQALQTINAAAMRQTPVEPQYVQQPLYMWPLLLALVWLSVWQGLAFIRRRA